MSGIDESPQNNDPDKYLYLKRPIYRDIYTSKDNCIKIPINKDNESGVSPHKYDYYSLKNILEKELGVQLSIEQVAEIGDGLIDFYQALYLEDL